MRWKIITILVLALMLLISPAVSSTMFTTSGSDTDYDPLVDIEVTVEIQAIRYLEEQEPESKALTLSQLLFNKLFDIQTTTSTMPNLYVKVFINDQEFTSQTYQSSNQVYNPDWSATANVPDEQEIVNIKIQLYDVAGSGMLLDLSGDTGSSNDGYDAEIEYNIKTGHWTGDDSLEDPSGYGRLCGCDDGTILEDDRDSELWFNIYQNDYDQDTIPYWTEVNEYSTDPEQKNSGDPDNDLIPVEWEYNWGYNPFSWDDHEELDPDQDSLNNSEEYLTSAWYSDPYRKDVYIEMDMMEEGPNGEKTVFPVNAGELIKNAFNRRNIIYHLDMGEMGGFEMIPFDSDIGRGDLENIYFNYFLHGDESNWRRGVFRYGLVVYDEMPQGYMFRTNGYQIATVGIEEKAASPFTGDRDIAYGSAYMHELGHIFAFNPIPGHNQDSKHPWQPGFWINRPYRSCMNYGWMYQFVDYSDGSRRDPDINDWARIDFYAFEHEWH